MKRKKKLTVGTVVRVKTPRGYGYMQYMGETPHYGPTVRVLPGCFRREDIDLDKLIAKDGYLMFYFVDNAIQRGAVTVVDVRDIPAGYTAPTRTRAAQLNMHGQTGKWRIIIDGDVNNSHKNVRNKLSPAEMSLPIGEWVSHPELVKRIATRWKPENEKLVVAPGNRPGYKPPKASSRKKRGELEVNLEHYLYLPTKSAASKAAGRLKRMDFGVELRKSADEKNWLVLGRHLVKPSEINMEILEAKLTRIANDYGGEYDGRLVNLASD